MHLFDSNAQPQSVTINTIFGAGAQGPYKLESVLGEEPVISINADNYQRKRILVIGEPLIPIQRDIAGDATLYVVSVDNQKVLLETAYKNGASTKNIFSSILKEIHKLQKNFEIFFAENRNSSFGSLIIRTSARLIGYFGLRFCAITDHNGLRLPASNERGNVSPFVILGGS